MHRTEQDAPLWIAIGRLEHEGVENWRKKFRQGIELEVALANDAKTVETHVTRRPGGNVWVTVSILARRAHEGMNYTFYLQRAGNHLYRRVEEPLASS